MPAHTTDAAQVVEMIDVEDVTVEMCLHCGHPIDQHGRRHHRGWTRYSCHDDGCRCTYRLLRVE